MSALSADTFYWIALSDTADSSHRRALDIASKRVGWTIITTDEVLAEFLTFFATAPEPMRRKAVINAQTHSQRPRRSRRAAEPGIISFGRVTLLSEA
jgi:hypothetical protein